MRKVYVDVTVRLIIRADDKVNINEVLDEMDNEFTSTTEGAEIEDTEIRDVNIVYSK